MCGMGRRARCRPLDSPASTAFDPAAAPTGVAVVDKQKAAGSLLDPTRRRILGVLQKPASATSVAHELRLSRQLVNYHVRALERAGLVEEVERRQRRGLEERIVRATASHFLISPHALGTLGDTPTDATDRFSATYQVAVAARTIREVSTMAALARDAGKRLTTLTIDAEVRLATPAARESFANELTEAVSRLVTKYHDDQSPDGRAYRLFVGAHPVYDQTHNPKHTQRERSRRS
jgi:DNA-binding transcriptional ArsR family regulator